MLRRLAHILIEATLGLAAAAALAACILIWRLAQGPLDITPLLQFFPATLQRAQLAVGGAALAWEGFANTDQPVDLRLHDVTSLGHGPLRFHVAQARVTLSLQQLLRGRLAPRSILVDGADVTLDRQAHAPLAQAAVPPAASPAAHRDTLEWRAQLHRVDLRNVTMTLEGAAPGVDLRASSLDLALMRAPGGGLSGTASVHLAAGSVQANIAVRASDTGTGTALVITTTPVSPAAVAKLSPAWAVASAVALPVAATIGLNLDASLRPQSARADIIGGSGSIAAGRGTVGIAAVNATVSASTDALTVQSLRVALAQAPDTTEPPPVVTLNASASLVQGQIQTQFSVRIPSMQLADLGKYWPEGTGGGSRVWLVQNVTNGHAHDAQATGTLMIPLSFADVEVTSLAGGMTADDVTVSWLRPIPPLTHGRAVLKIEGPDALKVTMDDAEQDHLHLLPGSFIHFNGLSGHHQFADIDVKIAGPLTDTLHLLAQPRLNLLSRSGLDFNDPAGEVAAHLTLHMPLEARVTMDQITIGATADLTGVHLARVAAGYDLDDAKLALRVNMDGLSLTGTGNFGGIASDLGVQMDFRNGGHDQVVQHITARGIATRAQLAQARLPAMALAVITEGSTGLDVAYDALRDNTAILRFDADFTGDALTTPFGWSKPAGKAASASAQIRLDHGRLAGIDQLRAKGPGLDISGNAAAQAQSRTLVLDRADIGSTSAHGTVRFPNTAARPLVVKLSGPRLDLRAFFANPAKPKTPPDAKSPADGTPAPDDTPGPPWAADLRFDRVLLTDKEVLSPFTLNAASNGTDILHADITGGPGDALSAHITPDAGGRDLRASAKNAGLVLRALGVAENLDGGLLSLTGRYDDTLAGHPLTGTASLENFTLGDAPGFGRLLQAMTLYGLSDVLRGPGLHFSRLIAPFTWQNQVLHLKSARAFSASLGITAQGSIDLHRRTADLTGTLVPAYFFNQLLGDIPVFGQIFSPEKGGGVFAARYSVRGNLADPQVGVNPLAALTPGFLREGFGILAPPDKK